MYVCISISVYACAPTCNAAVPPCLTSAEPEDGEWAVAWPFLLYAFSAHVAHLTHMSLYIPV